MMRGNAPEPHATWPPTMHYVRRGMRVLAEPTKDQGHLRVGWQGGAEQLDCRLGKLHWRRRTVARSKRGVHAQRSPCRPPKMLQCFRITSTGETIDKRLEVRGWSEFFWGGGMWHSAYPGKGSACLRVQRAAICQPPSTLSASHCIPTDYHRPFCRQGQHCQSEEGESVSRVFRVPTRKVFAIDS
jgi:hypothetical protein